MPGQRNRERIARSYPEILTTDWTTPINAAEMVEAAEHEIDPADITNLDACNRLLREIRATRRDPHITPATIEELVARETVVLKFRQDILNSAAVQEDSFINHNPRWLTVRDTIISAVARHKEAAADVLTALEQLGV